MAKKTMQFLMANRGKIQLMATLALLALPVASVAFGCPELQVGK